MLTLRPLRLLLPLIDAPLSEMDRSTVELSGDRGTEARQDRAGRPLSGDPSPLPRPLSVRKRILADAIINAGITESGGFPVQFYRKISNDCKGLADGLPLTLRNASIVVVSLSFS